ncbi:MAG: DUF3108 domain-containing protein [Gemmatimonadales bacterium]|nr:DUF3108 domain-containing protein [Gemmatimonadales bacterium]MBA3553506.1 DUF3108 domain-containing protein [Gemmatimonadales bacterium]
MPVPTLIAHAALLAQLVAPYPFEVGETLTYDAALGVFPVGTATATVSRLARERGKEAMVLTLAGEGGMPGIRVSYDLTSWVGTERFASLRFHRRTAQGSRVDEERFQIVPDSSRYRKEGTAQDWAAPRDALDELAFLYYLRTIPLEVGKSYAIGRYFMTGYNPIQVRVTGREERTLYDGRTLPCLAVELTARGSTLGVRFTDDEQRLPVELDLPLPYGSVTLVLSGAVAQGGGGAAAGP